MHVPSSAPQQEPRVEVRLVKVLDPVADVASAPEARPRQSLDTLRGKRAAFIWGQHVSTTKFWPAFEKAVESIFQPSEIHRLYKESTWNPASSVKLTDFVGRIDYAIAGVGG